MKRYPVVAFVSVLLAVAIAMPRVQGAEDIQSQIESANAEFMRAYAAGNAVKLAARYTEDGQLLPPGMPPVTGHAAIEAYWKASFEAGAAKAILSTTEVEQHGDTAIETGNAEILDAQGNRLDAAKYIVIWKRVGGVWKMHRDIFNSNLPSR